MEQQTRALAACRALALIGLGLSLVLWGYGFRWAEIICAVFLGMFVALLLTKEL